MKEMQNTKDNHRDSDLTQKPESIIDKKQER